MNLFMLSAPYQILNALEAIHYFQFVDNHLRIVDTGHFSRSQFDSVIDTSIWRSVRFHDFRYKLTDVDFGQRRPANLGERVFELYLVFSQFVHRQRADWIARSTSPVENLILGNYQRNYDGHMRHLANRLRYKSLYLLDVGTDTLRIARDRELDRMPQTDTLDVAPGSRWKRAKQHIRSSLIDWDTRGAEVLTFFTAYDLTSSGEDKVVRNSYAYLRTVLREARASDEVLFVGQPLVDQSYVTIETFKMCLGQIANHFEGQKLVYVPHPRESNVQLDAVLALGIEVRGFAAPFEHAVGFGGQRPRGIASFFSSVIENSATIFGETVALCAFRIPESRLLKQHSEVARIYCGFRENARSKIEIIDML